MEKLTTRVARLQVKVEAIKQRPFLTPISTIIDMVEDLSRILASMAEQLDQLNPRAPEGQSDGSR